MWCIRGYKIKQRTVNPCSVHLVLIALSHVYQKIAASEMGCAMDKFVQQNPTAHYDPLFSKKLGPTAAILLSRIIWSINVKVKNSESQYFIGGNWWMWNTIQEFCDYAGISKDSVLTAKRKLEMANLIQVEKLDSKTRDHTNHYSLNIPELFCVFPHTNPHFGVHPTIDSGESLPSVVENPYHRESGIPTSDSGEYPPSIVENPGNVPKSLTKSPSESLTENQSNRGGNAREEVAQESANAEPPPLDNLIQFPIEEKATPIHPDDLRTLETAKEVLKYEQEDLAKELADPYPCQFRVEELRATIQETEKQIALIEEGKGYYTCRSIKNTPPERSKELCEEWLRYGCQTARSIVFPLEKYKSAIDEILSETTYLERDLFQILEFLKSGKDAFVSRKFCFPWKWKNRWSVNDDETLLDYCFREMQLKIAKTGKNRRRN